MIRARDQYLLVIVFRDLCKRLFLQAVSGNWNLPAGLAPGLTDVIRGEFLPTLLATIDQPHNLDIARAPLDFG